MDPRDPLYISSLPNPRTTTLTMGEATKILRASIHTFLQSLHSFTIAAILVFPASTALLLSQSFTSSPIIQTITSRLGALFAVGGFPIATYLRLKLSQTIYSFLFTLPFSFTLLILAKSFIINSVLQGRLSRQSLTSITRLYCPLLLTHIFNSFIVLSANATVFSLLFLAFNAASIFGLYSTKSTFFISISGTVIYCIVLANAIVTCNLAVIISAADNTCGYLPVLKACVLIRGRVRTALALAVPANLAMAAVEALFQMRVVAAYRQDGWISPAMLSEAIMIGSIYSVLVVIDVIVSCKFYKSCELGGCRRRLPESEEEEVYYRGEVGPEEKGVIQV